MISQDGFANCKGGLNREKDILKTIIVSGFTLFETKLFLGFERANVTSNFYNEVKRQKHAFEVETGKAGGGPRNLERALDARMRKNLLLR